MASKHTTREGPMKAREREKARARVRDLCEAKKEAAARACLQRRNSIFSAKDAKEMIVHW